MRKFFIFMITVLMLLLTALPQYAAQSDCPPTRLIIGEQGRVMPGASNRVRSEPSTSGEQVGTLSSGTVFDVLDGPVCSGGFNWWQVEAGNLTGWTAEGTAEEYFLEPLAGEPDPAATVDVDNIEPAPCEGDAPEPRLIVGMNGIVNSNTPSRMRSEPSTSGTEIIQIDGFAEFVVLGGPVCGNGYNWWYVEHVGYTGWIAEGASDDYFVEPVAATPTPTATRTPLPTSTPTTPTATRTPLPTATPTITRTPTITLTPSITPTFTITPTATPVPVSNARHVEWSADGSTIAVSADGGIYLFDAENLSAEPRLLTTMNAMDMKFSPSDSSILVMSRDGATDNAVIVWDVESGETIEESIGADINAELPYSFSFSGDGSLMAYSTVQAFYIVSTEDWSIVKQIAVPSVTYVELSDDGDYAAAVVRDEEAGVRPVVYRLEDEEIIAEFDRGGLETRITDIAMSVDGSRVAVTDTEGSLQMWSVEDGERTSFIRGEGASINNTALQVMFASDGKHVITSEGRPQGVLRIFSVPELEQTRTYIASNGASTVYDIAFSPDGKHVAVATNAGVQIVETEGFTLIADLVLRR